MNNDTITHIKHVSNKINSFRVKHGEICFMTQYHYNLEIFIEEMMEVTLVYVVIRLKRNCMDNLPM